MKLNAKMMAERRQIMLQAAFRLFSEKGIETVSMKDIAEETDYGFRSFYRYFATKDDLVVAVSKWVMESFTAANRTRNPAQAGGTAADVYAFFLDSFLRMYRERSDILRFNQFFNIYIRSRHMNAEQLQPYSGMIDVIRERFHAVYERGKQDGTLRTDIPEETMFSATLHLMLAVVTRYAVGLAYDTGVDPVEELTLQRNMLLREFTIS